MMCAPLQGPSCLGPTGRGAWTAAAQVLRRVVSSWILEVRNVRSVGACVAFGLEIPLARLPSLCVAEFEWPRCFRLWFLRISFGVRRQ